MIDLALQLRLLRNAAHLDAPPFPFLKIGKLGKYNMPLSLVDRDESCVGLKGETQIDDRF